MYQLPSRACRRTRGGSGSTVAKPASANDHPVADVVASACNDMKEASANSDDPIPKVTDPASVMRKLTHRVPTNGANRASSLPSLDRPGSAVDCR